MNSEKPSSAPTGKLPASDPSPENSASSPDSVAIKRSPLKKIALIILALVVLVGGGATGWYWYYFHGNAFSPVELSQKEQQVIDGKLELAGGDAVFSGDAVLEPNDKPIILREDDRRTIIITEREINGLLHHNTDLAERLYIDLKRDAIVAKMIHLFEDDAPVVGGKTLRLNVTMKIFLDEDRELQIALGDVTVSGIPIPNAWLLDMKNKNLIDLDSGPEGTGLLKRIGDGVADFKVENDQIRIRLNE